MALAHALRRVDLAAGTMLFRQGDPGDSLYVIVRGRLRLVMTDDRGDSLVHELGPGQTVGELALLTGDPAAGRWRPSATPSSTASARRSSSAPLGRTPT